MRLLILFIRNSQEIRERWLLVMLTTTWRCLLQPILEYNYKAWCRASMRIRSALNSFRERTHSFNLRLNSSTVSRPTSRRRSMTKIQPKQVRDFLIVFSIRASYAMVDSDSRFYCAKIWRATMASVFWVTPFCRIVRWYADICFL